MIEILNLGSQCLTGIFPKHDEEVESGPLTLVKCKICDLVQLGHNYQLSKLYGDNYGYRSGLNQSMVKHLSDKVEKLCKLVKLESNDLIIDIGSNDGTTLGAYKKRDLFFLGIDPSGLKFKKYYKPDIKLVPEFFSENTVIKVVENRKAKVITSIAMFYDLEEPIQFAKEISAVLHKDGIWIFEQSYLPAMINEMAYDTICHEHLEYYGLRQINKILAAANLRILDVEFNNANGGSFSVTACHLDATFKSDTDLINKILVDEEQKGFTTTQVYEVFAKNALAHKNELCKFIKNLISDGAKIHVYGASTKGNVILQYCGFTKNDFEFVAEVNEDKFGRTTPGTKIPIISEKESKAMKPTHYLVMPWHFKDNILKREHDYILSGGKFIFPLPEIHIVDKTNIMRFIK
jgi:hypothetical protein